MAIPNQSIVSRNQLILSALCKRLNIDTKSFHADVLQKDIKILYRTISTTNPENNDEMMKWVTFAEEFSDACLKTLDDLNGVLASKSVLVGEGLTSSEADIVVFATVYSSVKSLQGSDKENLPHLMRWMDYIQNREDFGETFEPILVQKEKFDPPAPKTVEKVEVGSTASKTAKDSNNAEKTPVPNTEKAQGDAKAKTEKKKAPEKVAEKKAATEKKAAPEKVAEEKDKDVSVSLLKIQVGLIRKAYKHPSADSLLVEEIDTGDAKPRQVVSGLAKYCSPDELTNRLVVLITNVKPGKLRDVMSEGLVLCASSDDHTVVEPLIAPKGAKVGEIVTFSGHDGKPEDVLNPKKKQLDKITPHLYTDDKGVATFKGTPFMTSAGPCTSSIFKASIK